MELEKINKINVLKLHGSILQENSEALEEMLHRIIKSENRKLIVDMSDVTHICSLAVGFLVEYKKRAAEAGDGDIKLVVSDDDLLQLFEITMLNKVFSIHHSLDESLNAFNTINLV